MQSVLDNKTQPQPPSLKKSGVLWMKDKAYSAVD